MFLLQISKLVNFIICAFKKKILKINLWLFFSHHPRDYLLLIYNNPNFNPQIVNDK